jgi:hypothetical protein
LHLVAIRKLVLGLCPLPIFKQPFLVFHIGSINKNAVIFFYHFLYPILLVLLCIFTLLKFL